MKATTTATRIEEECAEIANLLKEKNRAYGNSALEPLCVMTSGSALELIAVRIDDKLSRIRNQGGLVKCLSDGGPREEDTVRDLIGYLILAKIAAWSLGSPQGYPEE